MKIKVVILLLILIGGALFINFKMQEEEKDICSETGIIFLKESERQYASALIDKTNAVVVIPETKSIIGNAEQLNCPNFDLPLKTIGADKIWEL